jgi:hypothetical protein
MENILKALNTVEEFVRKDKRVTSINFNSFNDRIEVLMDSESFIEFVESLNILPCHVEVEDWNSEEYDKQLIVEEKGILFFCLVDEHEYEAEFREWVYEEPNIDEEFITTDSILPENVRLMRDAGMSYKDFE